MKNRSVYIAFLCLLMTSGCGDMNRSGKKGPESENTVNAVIDQQMQEEESSTTPESEMDSLYGEAYDETAGTESVNDIEDIIRYDTDDSEYADDAANSMGERSDTDGSIDYDLTEMGSDMVYATVYQMMTTPEEYEGKTFRMEGLFYKTFYEPQAKYYYYCVIQDATACCAQGIEFVWEDGSHTDPEEYPADDTEIEVEGTFETYEEEGDPYMYCRLSNATFKVA